MTLAIDFRACAEFYNADSGGGAGAGSPAGRQKRSSRSIVVSEQLVDRIKARDIEALRELIGISYYQLVRFATTIVRSEDDAEDVVQDVITAVWNLGNQWDPGNNPVGYLFTSIRNQSLKEIRRRQRAEQREVRSQGDVLESRYGSRVDPAENVLDRLVADEADDAQRRAVFAVLEGCTERQRTAYDLRYHRGLTVPAIAEVLGITTKSAEQLVRRVTHLVLARLQRG